MIQGPDADICCALGQDQRHTAGAHSSTLPAPQSGLYSLCEMELFSSHILGFCFPDIDLIKGNKLISQLLLRTQVFSQFVLGTHDFLRDLDLRKVNRTIPCWICFYELDASVWSYLWDIAKAIKARIGKARIG